MLDLDGFFTSLEFVTQLASIISAILSALFGEFFASLFSGA